MTADRMDDRFTNCETCEQQIAKSAYWCPHCGVMFEAGKKRESQLFKLVERTWYLFFFGVIAYMLSLIGENLSGCGWN